jgi:acetamidase/formamidase
MAFAEREPLRHRYPNGPYSMLGPVEVTGAEAGDVIECRFQTLRTKDWGWNSFPLGVGALPADRHPDQALATSSLVLMVTGAPPVIRTTVQILQHVVKVDGRWLISRRSVAGPNS